MQKNISSNTFYKKKKFFFVKTKIALKKFTLDKTNNSLFYTINQKIRVLFYILQKTLYWFTWVSTFLKAVDTAFLKWLWQKQIRHLNTMLQCCCDRLGCHALLGPINLVTLSLYINKSCDTVSLYNKISQVIAVVFVWLGNKHGRKMKSCLP